MKNDIITYCLLIVVTLLVVMNVKTCNEKTNVQDNQRILNDSMKTYRNSLNQEVAERETLQGTASDLKEVLKTSKDSMAKLLLATITHQNNSVGVAFSNNTTGIISTKTDTLFYPQYKIVPIDGNTIYPTYGVNYHDKWMKISGRISKDSTKLTYQVHNEFTLTQKTEGNSLFKKRELITTITNINPNTTTQEVLTYRVKKPNKITWTESLLIGVGIGIIIKTTIIK